MNKKSLKTAFKFEHWMVIAFCLMLYDAVAVNLSYFLALWLRFDTRFSAIPPEYMNPFRGFAPYYTVICIVILWRLRLYKSIWRFASYNELLRCILASGFTSLVQIAGITIFFKRMPINKFICDIE